MTKHTNKTKKSEGQIMLLSVLLISSAVLGAASLAGLLVLFQLRQTGDAETSARAVFAADAGIERVLYERYQDEQIAAQCDGGGEVIFNIDSENVPGEFTIPNVRYIVEGDCSAAKSAALAGRSARAFEIFMEGLEAYGGQFVE